MALTVTAAVVAVYVVAVLWRYGRHGSDWPTFQNRDYPLRPWRSLSGPPMVNPMAGWRSRNIPDPVVTARQYERVADCADIRERGGWDHELFEQWGINPHPPAPLMKHLDPDALALSSGLLVEMDKPIDLWHEIVDYVESQGVPRRQNRAAGGDIDFLWVNRQTVKVAKALRRAFRATWRTKYFHGVARPGEVAGRQLGPYPHPAHGSDCAGHGTGAGVCVARAYKTWDFANHPQVWRNVTDMAAHWATYRTTGAQVHRQSENIRGLIMGVTVTLWPIHIPLTRIGSWRSGLKWMARWYPEWDRLL